MNEKSIPNLHFNGSEDHFTCWSRLPIELKVKVIRNLPYPTLRNFMFLSKECMEVSSLLRASVYEVDLWEEVDWSKPTTGVESLRIVVMSDMPYGSTNADNAYVIGFSSMKGGSCIAHRRKKEGRVFKGLEYPMESCSTVSIRVFLEITKYLKPENVILHLIRTNSADVKSTLSKIPLLSTSSITCRRLTVHAPDLSFLSLLMRHVTPGCELGIYVDNSFGFVVNILNSMIFDFEVVKAAPSIKIYSDCEVSDEQFLCLRASELYLQAPKISEKGLNGLILQWMQGRRKIVWMLVMNTKTLSYDMVFENVDKTEIQCELELLQIPSIDEYNASVCNGLGDRLLVHMGLHYCLLEDPYAAKMSRT